MNFFARLSFSASIFHLFGRSSGRNSYPDGIPKYTGWLTGRLELENGDELAKHELCAKENKDKVETINSIEIKKVIMSDESDTA